MLSHDLKNDKTGDSGRWNKIARAMLLGVMIPCVAGCSSVARVHRSVTTGEYGDARVALQKAMDGTKPSNRDYHLNRIRLGMVDLADGQPELANATFAESFEFLRTQGVNADKTVSSVVINEDLKLWKGEPFEQALSYHYIACNYAALGQWDNARAAAQASLFLLRNFGENEEGERLSTLDIATKAAAADNDEDEEQDGDAYLDGGYSAIETDFALGYLMNGLANWELGRRSEAEDNFRKAINHNADLGFVVDELRSGSANTILVVDYGLGPKKVGYGPDKALGRFDPVTESASRTLNVSLNGQTVGSYFPACDVNQMAQDHMWNNLEDVRLAKSRVGSALLGIGAGVAAYGSGSDSSDTAIVGLAMMLAGAIAKAGAHVDERYCDIMPLSVFIALVHVSEANTTVAVQVGDERGARMVLAGVDPPSADEPLQLLYVRLNYSGDSLPYWAVSGEVHYANDHLRLRVQGDDLPYILGGSCVRTPSEETLSRYHRAGHLTDLNVTDLENLYHVEGIAFEPSMEGYTGKHVLEGGTSLAGPSAGSAGYARLFGQLHDPYRPRSREVKALIGELAVQGN